MPTLRVPRILGRLLWYLLAMVRDELAAQAGISPEDVDTGGYRIVTTIDRQHQEAPCRFPQDSPPDC